MKFYIQPLFSNNHPNESIVKTLGSSDHQFSSIRVIYKKKETVKNYIITLSEVFKFPKLPQND